MIGPCFGCCISTSGVASASAALTLVERTAVTTNSLVVDLATTRPPIAHTALADIATGLAQSARRWLPLLPALDGQRTGLRMIGTPDYDAWLLRWPPGTAVSPHDHGDSVGVFTVVTGQLTEVRWEHARRRTRQVRPGHVISLGRGVVHDVIAGTTASLSVHVYSPPLEVMGYYADGGVRLLDRQPVDRTDGPA